MTASDQSTTKQCMHCKKPIDVMARRCHFCQMWQTRFFCDPSAPSFKYLLFGLLGVFVLVVGFVITMMVHDVWKDSHRKAEPPKGIVISSSHLVVTQGEVGKANSLAVFGTIENSATITWSDILFQIKILNPKGELIDVISRREYNLILFPRTPSLYRVEQNAALPISAYEGAKVEIRVLSAKRYYNADE